MKKDILRILRLLMMALSPVILALAEIFLWHAPIDFWNLAEICFIFVGVVLTIDLLIESNEANKSNKINDTARVTPLLAYIVAYSLVMVASAVAIVGTTLLVSKFISLTSLVMGLACGALSVAAFIVSRLEKKNILGKNRAQKIFMISLMTAATLTAITAAVKPFLWGAAAILIVIGARLNANLESKKFDVEKIFKQMILLQIVWTIAAFLGMII